jgi:tetratricopeptide (TPR) repeat protein
MKSMLRALVAIAVSAIAGVAHAEPPLSPSTPGHSASATPLAKAEALLAKLPLTTEAPERFNLANEAEEWCEKAILARPKDPLPHLTLSRALTVADLQHPEACRPGRCERAVEELKKARVLDGNGVEAERIASELGIVLSRLGRFDEALAEYDRALKLVDAERRPNILEDDNKAVLYGNSAETLMALGRLDEAIERYRLAEAAANPGDTEWQLAEWGLGVALDRDEQVEKSRAAIWRALEASSSMAPLAEDGVFFEPAGDKLYYVALGHEVYGDTNDAIKAWGDYLGTKPIPRWARRARNHLEGLKRASKEPADPSIEVSFGAPEMSRALRTPDSIAGTLGQYSGDLRTCFVRAVRGKRRGPVSAHIRLALELTPPGWPMRPVHVMSALLFDDADFIKCIESAAKDWRFKPVDGDEHDLVIIPIRFESHP